MPVSINLFWGSASWSRCQLLGEIASGSWGVCEFDITKELVVKPAAVFESTYPRLLFAPKTSMTDDYESENRRLSLLRVAARAAQRARLAERAAQRAAREASNEAARACISRRSCARAEH